VALVLRNVQEAAQNHLQVMAEELVQEQRSKDSRATHNPALLTGDGQVGVDGRHVVNLVELVPNNVLEAVQSHVRIMAGNIVQEQRGKHKSAIRNLAL